MALRKILFAALLLTLAGCAAPTMHAKGPPAPPPADQAQVIFLRDNSFYGGGVDGTIFDTTTEETRIIGSLSRGTSFAYNTTPGRHVFMVIQENADFMEADLAPGKIYYAQGLVRMGFVTGRFSLWPARSNTYTRRTLSDKELADILKSTTWTELSPDATRWFEQNHESIEQKRQSYWQKWQGKDPADIDQRTLHPNDGVDPS